MTVIAEIGSNHEGDIKRAKEMILVAKECGADIAKFQLFKPEQYLHNIPFPEKWIEPLDEFCNQNGIGFLLSVFYKYNGYLPVVKIAYSQRHNFNLISYYSNSRLIVSGDYQTLFPDNCIKLFCSHNYPAKEEDYDSYFGPPFDGISDHTNGIKMVSKWEPIPKIIEKHFKLGDEKKSPDAGSFAVNPKQLKELCECLKKQ